VSGAVTALLICLAGGIGAALRLVLDSLIRTRLKTTYPIGTTIINVTGSLLLGLLTGLTAAQLLQQPFQLIMGTGLLGGYTTFSAASFETVRLLEDRQYLAAALNSLGMLISCTAAAALGYGVALLIYGQVNGGCVNGCR
jgi:CrcB protein